MKWLPCLALYLCAVSTYAQPLPALIPYYNGAAWGYCDSNKKIKIQPQWYEAGLFYDGRAIVKLGRRDSFTHALINAKGEYIIPPERRWNGELATPPQVLQLNARNAAGKWGLIDSVNNVLIPFLYDVPKGYPFRAFFTRRPAWDKLFMVVTKDGKKGVVDSANNTLIPFIYDDIWMSGGTDGMAFRYDSTVFFKVWKDGKAGIIDTAGREIIPCVYDALYYDINVRQQPPFLITRKNGRMGAIDWQQQVLVPFAYDSVKAVDNSGLQFYTFQDDKRGYIDRSRKLEIQPLYDGVEPQDDTYIVVKVYDDKRSKYKNGLYNTKGKLLVKPKYDNLYVQNGNIVVTKYGDGHKFKRGTLNKTTYLPNGFWKTYELPLEWFRSEGTSCGTGRANMDTREYPHMPGKNFGEKVYGFIKDGIDYAVIEYIDITDDEGLNKQHLRRNGDTYYAVAGKKSGQQYYAIVDIDKNYIIAPQSKYVIFGGDIGRGVLFAKDSNKYGLVDIHLKPLTNFQELAPYAFFYWQGKYYMLACNADTCGKRVLNNGKVPKAFKNYYVEKAGNMNGEINSNYNFSGTLFSRNIEQKKGFLDISGNIKWPQVSFHYNDIISLHGNIFIVKDGNYYLVDKSNKQLMPNLNVLPSFYIVSNVSSITQHKYIFPPNLYCITYIENGSSRNIYVDIHGTIYADNLSNK